MVRKKFMAFVLFLSLAMASSYSENQAFIPSGASLSKLVSPALPAKATYSIPWEKASDGKYYYLVAVSGKPSYFVSLWQEGQDTYGKFITDDADAYSALAMYYNDRQMQSQISAYAKSASGRLAALTGGFEKSQGECRRVMGIAKSKCDSFESCQKACYAVTSFCQPIAAQFGKSFIYDIWAYENASKALFAVSSDERAAAKKASENQSDENLKAYAVALEKADNVARVLTSGTKLVTEMYCKVPPIDMKSIADARLEIARAIDLRYELSNAHKIASDYAAAGLAASGNSTGPILLTPKIEKKTEGSAASDGIQPSSKANTSNSLIDINFSAIMPIAAVVVGMALAAAIAIVALASGKRKGL